MKRSKSTFLQNEQPAIGHGDDVGLPRHAGEKRHLAKQVAAAERNAAAGKDDLGGAGGDEIAGVTLFPLAHDPFARHGEPGSQQLLHPFELLVGKISEEVETTDQLARIESKIKARPRLSLSVLDAALEVLVDLGRDKTFLKQRVVSSHLAPHRGLAQEPGFEGRRVLRILPAQRVEGGCRALEANLENGVDELDDPLAENRARPHGVRAHELLDQQTRNEQHLEPVAEPVGEKAHDSKTAIEEIGDAERERKGERSFGAALIAETPAASRAFAQSFGVAQQRLHGDGRGGALRHDFKRQHPFLVAERHQADREALMIREVCFRGAGRFCRRHSGLIGRKRAGDG